MKFRSFQALGGLAILLTSLFVGGCSGNDSDMITGPPVAPVGPDGSGGAGNTARPGPARAAR